RPVRTTGAPACRPARTSSCRNRSMPNSWWNCSPPGWARQRSPHRRSRRCRRKTPPVSEPRRRVNAAATAARRGRQTGGMPGGRIAVLLVGLCTVDLVQRVEEYPQLGQKAQSTSVETAAGGPASHAAVAVTALGGRATLLSGLGRHPLASLAREDLVEQGVALLDAAADHDAAPAVSAVTVRDGDGERTIVSHNAAGMDL